MSSEQMLRASHNMDASADMMNRAASTMSESVCHLERVMNTFIAELTTQLDRVKAEDDEFVKCDGCDHGLTDLAQSTINDLAGVKS